MKMNYRVLSPGTRGEYSYFGSQQAALAACKKINTEWPERPQDARLYGLAEERLGSELARWHEVGKWVELEY